MNGIGLLAGAAGTIALDAITYLDMLRSGRPASTVPSEVAKRLAAPLGISALASDDDEKAPNRRSAAGALFGYGVGLGSAVVYADLRPAFRDWLPWPVAGTLLGLATVVASEGTATALGATDWSTWTANEWAADLIPRTAFGLTVAYVVERLTELPDALAADADARGSAFVDDTVSTVTFAPDETVGLATDPALLAAPDADDEFRLREDA